MHYYPLLVLSASWLFWFWETYLSFRQYRVYLSTKESPHELKKKIDAKTFSKAKAYSIDKAHYGFISSFINQIESTLIICYYLLPYFWKISGDFMDRTLFFNSTPSVEREIFQSLLFILFTSLASKVVSLPLEIYNIFVIEERHGFNKQTAGFFAWDSVKKFLVSYTITSPVVAATVYIVKNGGPYFFLYLWAFLFVFVLLLTFFSGEIMALFDKFTPLPEGELRERIVRLANEVNYPLSNIYVVEGSKRSSHSNAYLSGILNRKRIVIYDTLIEGYYDKKDSNPTDEGSDAASSRDSEKKTKKEDSKGCNHDEILAILCHELGHWKHSHLIKNLTFAEINYFMIFVIFSMFYKDADFYRAFGFVNQMPVIIGFALLMMVLTPYNEFAGFISIHLSRYFEYQADHYAKRKGYSEQLKTALVKLNIDNLGFPVHDELYSKFNHSHPTLMQRLKALSKSD